MVAVSVADYTTPSRRVENRLGSAKSGVPSHPQLQAAQSTRVVKL